MINKLQLYLYRLRPINLEPTNIRINETYYRDKLKSNVSGTVVFGYGRLFYLMSCRKYGIGTPVLFSKEKEERKLLLGRIKEIKKIEINKIIAHKPPYYPFFFFYLSIKRESWADPNITNHMKSYIIYKILERKDYKIIYE
jgi:hypothetical protein